MLSDIYLDNNATTLMRDAVRQRLWSLLDGFLGNPSSPHSWGQRSREIIESARTTIALALGCYEEDVFFTSCASESNTMLMRSFSPRRLCRKTRIITSEIEHPSILRNAELLLSEGADVVVLPVDANGLIEQKDLADALREETDLVSIQWVNNETGVIQDIPALAALAKKNGAYFHTDAVQAIGKIPIDLRAVPVDFLSLTGHKLHAPQGVGAILAKDARILLPLVIGGEQEKDKRAGTENLLGIAALGFALEDRFNGFSEYVNRLKEMRDLFENTVIRNDAKVKINGLMDMRVANTCNLRFLGIDGRALTAQLDKAGVICSQSSACTSSIPEPSHVLTAMGLSEGDAYASIRFSFSVDNSLEEAKRAAQIVVETANRVRATTEAYSI